MSQSPLCRLALTSARLARGGDRQAPPGLGLRLAPRPPPPRTPVRKRTLYIPPPPVPSAAAVADIPVVAMDLDDDDGLLEGDDPFDWKDHISVSIPVSPARSGDGPQTQSRDEVMLFDEPEELLSSQPPPELRTAAPTAAPPGLEAVICPTPPSPYDPEKVPELSSSPDIPIHTVTVAAPVTLEDGPAPTDAQLVAHVDALSAAVDAAGLYAEGARAFGEAIAAGGLGEKAEARARYHRARCLVECGDQHGEAFDELVRALNLDPHYYLCARALATVLHSRGSFSVASTILGASIAIAKSDGALSSFERDRVLAELRADLHPHPASSIPIRAF